MIKIKAPVRRGDGPYRITTPLTVNVNGALVTTTADWLAGDGAGSRWRMQVWSRDDDSGVLLFDVPDVVVQDIGGQMHIVATIWPEQTSQLPLRGTPVADIELIRSGNRADTVVFVEFDVQRDVTR